MRYNEKHGIIPKTIIKPIKNTLEITKKVKDTKKKSKSQVVKEIDSLYALMKQASANLDFETAIKLRDQINELKKYKD
jgi:excinuclease ABC subunit B